MLRRPYDLAAIALALAACLVFVEAGFQAPRIAPVQAADHIGERVRVAGMIVELHPFGDGGGRLVLAAGGGALHARAGDVQGLAKQAWVEAIGTVRRDGGLPLLEVEDVVVKQPPPGTLVPLAEMAIRPEQYVDDLVQVQGTVSRGQLSDGGRHVRLIGDVEPGPQRIDGILRYDVACLCYAFHVSVWQP